MVFFFFFFFIFFFYKNFFFKGSHYRRSSQHGGRSDTHASVSLRDPTTNQTRKTLSESDGSYRITALIVSTYEVRAESAGFAVYINPQITLLLGQTTTLDITLQPAGINAAIEVTDKPLVIDTSQTASTTSVTQESTRGIAGKKP